MLFTTCEMLLLDRLIAKRNLSKGPAWAVVIKGVRVMYPNSVT